MDTFGNQANSQIHKLSEFTHAPPTLGAFQAFLYRRPKPKRDILHFPNWIEDSPCPNSGGCGIDFLR
jgi:hypothetical protein